MNSIKSQIAALQAIAAQKQTGVAIMTLLENGAWEACRAPQSLAKVFQTEQAARDYLSDCDSIIIIDLYMRESIGKRLTVKHLTTVCLQSDKGQVKQLSLYSHTVFFATLRRTLRATVHFGAHTWESGVLIRSCARMHSSVLIREHLLSEKLAFALNGHS